MLDDLNFETMPWVQQPYEDDSDRMTLIFHKYYLPQDSDTRSIPTAYRLYLVSEEGWTVPEVLQNITSDRMRPVRLAAQGKRESQIQKAARAGVEVIPWEERAKAYDAYQKNMASEIARQEYLDMLDNEDEDYNTQLRTWRKMWNNFDRSIDAKNRDNKTISRTDTIMADALVRARHNIGKMGLNALSQKADINKIISDLEDDASSGVIQIKYVDGKIEETEDG